MKPYLIVVGLGCLAAFGTASAQQAATVQMQCHDLAANGNFLASDEVLITGMACKPVKVPAKNAQTMPNDPSAAPAKFCSRCARSDPSSCTCAIGGGHP